MGPGRGGRLQGPSRQVKVMVKGCRNENSFITCFALPDLTLEKLLVVDGGEEPRPSHYRDKGS